jgi:CAAX protease family protein
MPDGAMFRAGWWSWEGPRLRILPILLVLVLGKAILEASFHAANAILFHTDPRLIPRVWPSLIIAEPLELSFALLGIAIASRWLPEADFSLRRPAGRSLIGKAALWGLAFGLIMLVADDGAALSRGLAPTAPAAGAVDIVGWLTFELFIVGICEETLFRGLLLGLLEALSPSRLRIGRFSLSTAGYTIALVFALAHVGNFRTMPWPMALSQQLYAAALGVLYAWLRERSGSLAAPIVAHNLSDFSEDAIVFALANLLPH